MANSKAVVASTSIWSESFIAELLPAAEKTALLYHLSYLCLANLPSLERLIRSRAIETQILFGSSEVLLLKCMSTSKNMVELLIPMLKAAVEKNKPTLAIKYLEKTRRWITEITANVKEIVDKYEKHSKDVANSTSDVIAMKDETDKKIEKTQEVKAIEETVAKYKSDLDKIMAELATVEEKIETKTTELEEFVRQVAIRSSTLALVTAVIPFFGAIFNAILSMIKSPGSQAKIRKLENEVSRLTAEKMELRSKEWGIQHELIDWQMKLTISKIEKGSIPSPEHLKDVQESLSTIVQILIELKKFWEKTSVVLDHLQQKTLAGEDLIDDLQDFKEEFLDTLVYAAKVWNKFGVVCHSAERMFSNQSKDAYKFLEVSPSSLSMEQWKEEYDSVKEKLKKISPAPPAIEKPAAPAIEEPAAPAIEEPAAPAIEEPASPAIEEPAAPAIEEPAAPAIEEPAAPAIEEPAAPAIEEPAAPAIEEPAAPAIEEPAAPAIEEPAAPAIEEPAAPAIEEPAAPAIEEPATLAIEEPAAPAIEEPAVPAIEEPASPAIECSSQ